MSHHLVGAAEIAQMLGVSRQRVGQLLESHDDFPAAEAELAGGRVWSRTAIETWIRSHPERGGPEAKKEGGFFSSLTPPARQAVVAAQEEARLMRHNYIGTEHLLLGLAARGEDAGRGLADLGITLERAREEVRKIAGPGSETPQAHIPFTPRAKKALQLAAGEALRLGHDAVGVEHVFLGLLDEVEGVAYKVLLRLGLNEHRVRQAVVDWLAGGPNLRLAAEGLLRCSFCGKLRSEVRSLIAGPNVYICDDCVGLCVQIVDDGQPEDPVRERLHSIEARIGELESRLPPDS